MIRYSSYAGTNYRTNQSAPTKLLCSLAIEYRELQDLRERVRMAEASARDAAARLTSPSENSQYKALSIAAVTSKRAESDPGAVLHQ